MATMRPQFLGHGSEPNSGVTFRRGPILDQKTSLLYGTPHDTHNARQALLGMCGCPAGMSAMENAKQGCRHTRTHLAWQEVCEDWAKTLALSGRAHAPRDESCQHNFETALSRTPAGWYEQTRSKKTRENMRACEALIAGSPWFPPVPSGSLGIPRVFALVPRCFPYASGQALDASYPRFPRHPDAFWGGFPLLPRRSRGLGSLVPVFGAGFWIHSVFGTLRTVVP